MKKFIAGLAMVIFTAACTPAATEDNISTPMEKCCCMKMEGDQTIKEKLGLNKTEGMQCMKGKDGKKSCCNKNKQRGNSGHNH